VKKDRKYLVYLVTNLSNGKQYAGQTCRGLETRWREHVLAAQRGERFALQRAIRKHGEQNFSVVVLRENLTKQQANEEEQLAIRTLCLNNQTFGYNMTEGGEGREGDYFSWLSTSDIIRLYSRGNTMKEVAEKLGAKLATVWGRLKKHEIPRRETGRTDIVAEEVLKLYTEGNSLQQIADLYGSDQVTIRKRLEKTDQIIRGRGRTDIPSEEMVRMFSEGLSAREIAKKLGVIPATVKRHLSLKGIQPHRPGRQSRADLKNTELVRLYNQGVSLEQIAETVGAAPSTVRLRLVKEGVDTSREARNARMKPNKGQEEA
jgi:group I intron endonuclease